MRFLISCLATLSVATTAMATPTQQQAPSPQSIRCVAVFELMHRAAPSWTNQRAAQVAWQSWDMIAQDLTRQARVDFNEQLQREMEALANETAQYPNALSRKAMKCVSEAPAI